MTGHQLSHGGILLLATGRVSLVAPCTFSPKILEGGENLQMIFCQSVSAVWVASRLIGGTDIQTLIICCNQIRLNISDLEMKGTLKHYSHTRKTLVQPSSLMLNEQPSETFTV